MRVESVPAGMNLYPGQTESPRATPEWSLALELQQAASAAYCVGILSQAGVVKCRVSIACGDMNEDALRRAVAEKARAWIQQHSARPLDVTNASGATDARAVDRR